MKPRAVSLHHVLRMTPQHLPSAVQQGARTRLIAIANFTLVATLTLVNAPLPLLVLATDIVDRLVDEDGRYLGEHSVAASISEQVRCPYEGSRAGLPMNQSALRQLAARFKDSRAVFGAAYDLVQAPLVRAEACFVLPLLVAQPVPGAISVASKAAKGLRPVLRALVVERALNADGTPLTPEGVLEHAEITGAMVGNHEACAAPPAMIVDAVTVLLHGRGDNQRGSLETIAGMSAVDAMMWRQIAKARTLFEVTRVVAWAARWWLRPGSSRERRSGPPLPLHGVSVNDRLRALAKRDRVDVVMRLRPFVDDQVIQAIGGDDLDGVEQALLAAAQSAEDIQRRLLGLPALHLTDEVVAALLGARPP